MSSSNRQPNPCDAAIYRDDKPIGPMRLPRIQAVSFVKEFNRLYGKAGMKVKSPEKDPERQNEDDGQDN